MIVKSSCHLCRYILTAVFLGMFSLVLTTSGRSFAQQNTYLPREHLVIDLKHDIEWLRCTVGKTWDGFDCVGEAVRLNHSQVKIAVEQANQQLGNGWRLPSLQELQDLLCESCEELSYSKPLPMIDQKTFPSTEPEPYWTNQQNGMSPSHYFSVNFFNGWTYGRFLPSQTLAVRLVRDRP